MSFINRKLESDSAALVHHVVVDVVTVEFGSVVEGEAFAGPAPMNLASLTGDVVAASGFVGGDFALRIRAVFVTEFGCGLSVFERFGTIRTLEFDFLHCFGAGTTFALYHRFHESASSANSKYIFRVPIANDFASSGGSETTDKSEIELADCRILGNRLAEWAFAVAFGDNPADLNLRIPGSRAGPANAIRAVPASRNHVKSRHFFNAHLANLNSGMANQRFYCRFHNFRNVVDPEFIGIKFLVVVSSQSRQAF